MALENGISLPRGRRDLRRLCSWTMFYWSADAWTTRHRGHTPCGQILFKIHFNVL